MSFTRSYVVTVPMAQVSYPSTPTIELPPGVEMDSVSIINKDSTSTVLVAVNSVVTDKAHVTPVEIDDLVVAPAGNPDAAWTIPSRIRKLWMRLAVAAAADVEVHVVFAKEK